MKKLIGLPVKIFKNYFKGLKKLNGLQLSFYVLILFSFFVLFVYESYAIWITLCIIILITLYFLYMNAFFIKFASGNGIFFGGRGKGKGILLQKRINADGKCFSNVPYGKNVEILNIKEYIQSIGDNTILDTINDTITIVEKVHKFEGKNVYWDDVVVYAPNFMDGELKKVYPSMPLTLAINRHLYDAFMIITTQTVERPYKILRELQSDFSIKALKTVGFGKIWNAIPILRNFVFVKIRMYEEQKSAINGILPFRSKGVVNTAISPAYLTGGQAIKDTHLAEHGLIKKGWVSIRKSKLYYDTRIFHKKFYGVEAPKH